MISGRRRNFAALLALLAPLALFVATAAHALTLPELMRTLAGVPATRAEFIEIKTLAALAKPLESSGVLSYQRPDKLERWTQKPTEERMTIAGSEITIENVARGQKRTFPLAANPPMWAFVESIRATLSGNQATLERFYWVKLEGERNAWTLNLEPRDTAMNQYIQLIRLGGEGPRVLRMEVFETSGDRSVTRIKAQ